MALYPWAKQTVSWFWGPTPVKSGLLCSFPSGFYFSAWRGILSCLTAHLLPIPVVPHPLEQGEDWECSETCTRSNLPLAAAPPQHPSLIAPGDTELVYLGDVSPLLQEAMLAPCTSHILLLPGVSQMPAMGHQYGMGKRMWML